MSDLVSLEKIKAIDVFTVTGIDPVLESITKEVRSFKADISTAKGRKEVAAMAHKVAQSKTFLDGLGKDLVSDWKERAKVVDSSRKKMRDYLDKLKDETRKPLTDWEMAEKQRIEKHQTCLDMIRQLSLVSHGVSSAQLRVNLGVLEETASGPQFEEFEDAITIARLEVIESLRSKIEAQEKLEAEQAELERLRKAEAERKAKERDELIAKQAAERARQEAEAKAKAEADKNEQIRLKAIRDKEAAEERHRQAEARAKNEKEQAEKQRIIALEQAKKNEELAARREREKIEAEKQRLIEEEKKREANVKHRRMVNNEAVDDLLKIDGLGKDYANLIVVEIAKGNVANVSIKY